MNAAETMIYLSNTAHQREVEDLKAAGLNPILSANGQGASVPNITDSSGSKKVSAKQAITMQKNNPANRALDVAEEAIQALSNSNSARNNYHVREQRIDPGSATVGNLPGRSNEIPLNLNNLNQASSVTSGAVNLLANLVPKKIGQVIKAVAKPLATLIDNNRNMTTSGLANRLIHEAEYARNLMNR